MLRVKIDQQQIYKEMVAYLTEKNIRLDKESFSAILKASGWVIDGHTVKYACGMCSMFYHADTESGHMDESFMRKHVRAITKRLVQ